MIKVYENVFVLCIISACFSSFFYFIFMHDGGKKGVINIVSNSFMTHLAVVFFHTLYEIFVLCIIYCTPQNSGGKCVLTENIVKIQKIYDAIEEKTQEELWRKNHTINQGQFFSVDIFHWPFSFPKFDLLSGNMKKKKNAREKKLKNKIYEHASAKSWREWERKTAENIAFRGIIWFKKSFQEQKNKKLFQFAKIAHQSKTEFPQTISRKPRRKERKIFLCI